MHTETIPGTGGIRSYFRLVKFSHTVFALPFAMIGFFEGIRAEADDIHPILLLQVLLCMVFARNAAMGFNRYADRKIDAKNIRTARREIPAGIIGPRRALIFVCINGLLFILAAATINPLTGWLALPALFIILGYSLTKRFTAWCHIALGLSLAIAPMGAYIAVTGHFGAMPALLSVIVIGWVAGFDIFYALQDEAFDRENRLYSMPALLGGAKALTAAILLRTVSVAGIVCTGIFFLNNRIYWTGAALFIALLVFQHLIVKPNDLSRVNLAFATLNGAGSILYALFTITAMYL